MYNGWFFSPASEPLQLLNLVPLKSPTIFHSVTQDKASSKSLEKRKYIYCCRIYPCNKFAFPINVPCKCRAIQYYYSTLCIGCVWNQIHFMLFFVIFLPIYSCSETTALRQTQRLLHMLFLIAFPSPLMSRGLFWKSVVRTVSERISFLICFNCIGNSITHCRFSVNCHLLTQPC